MTDRIYSQEEVQELLGALTDVEAGGLCSVCVRADDGGDVDLCKACVTMRDEQGKWPHFELYHFEGD